MARCIDLGDLVENEGVERRLPLAAKGFAIIIGEEHQRVLQNQVWSYITVVVGR